MLIRSTFVALVCFLILTGCSDSRQVITNDGNDQELTLVFYNVENLFDTEDDPNIFDEEFTPTGSKQWTRERYADKLQKLSAAIIATDKELPEVVGLCEVENLKVLQDLFSQKGLDKGNYGIVHRDSPDGRGIDCALAYRMDIVQVIRTDWFTSPLPVGDRPNTREVLYAELVKDTDTLHVFVNHWPSRSGGQVETEPNRLTIAMLVRERVDAILTRNKDARIVLMGDFNDYPNDRSFREVLGSSGKGDGHLFNFMEKLHKDGEGSYNYKGEWGTLDQFLGSPALIEASNGFSAKVDAARICKEDFLLYVNEKGESSPSRTYGKDYYGGYSDHLPVVLQLEQR